MSPVEWFKNQHLLPPALQCVRCAKRVRLNQKIVQDRDVGGFVHHACLLGFEVRRSFDASRRD